MYKYVHREGSGVLNDPPAPLGVLPVGVKGTSGGARSYNEIHHDIHAAY